MRVLVFEYITGGGLAGLPIIASLAEEGDMMLRALLHDLDGIADIELMVLRDERLGALATSAMQCLVGDIDEFQQYWLEALQWADAVWPVAPENDGILAALSEQIVEHGCILLNSRPEAVRIAASKYATHQALKDHALPVVPTWRMEDEPLCDSGRWVVKPDDGAGCQGTRMRHSVVYEQLSPGEIVQPYIPGQAASLSLIVAGQSVCLLGCNNQQVVLINDGFTLLGCIVNGLNGDRAAYQVLAEQVAAAVPGLWGYVGIDFVETPEGPQILEINPRLTTSYVGLSRSLGVNVADWIIRLAHEPLPLPQYLSPEHSVYVDLEDCHVA